VLNVLLLKMMPNVSAGKSFTVSRGWPKGGQPSHVPYLIITSLVPKVYGLNGMPVCQSEMCGEL
jgi:hypothetical protein